MDGRDQQTDERPPVGAMLAPLVRASLPGERSAVVEAAGLARLQERRARRPVRFLVFAVPTLAAAGLALFLWPSHALRWRTDADWRAQEGFVSAPPGASTPLDFSDGTHVQLSPRTRARVASLGSRGARVVLESGESRVTVQKRPRADWRFEAGPYSVLVTGTSFDLAWSVDDQIFSLVMREGHVVVTGPRIERGLELGAGDEFKADVRAGQVSHGPASAAHPVPAQAIPHAASPPPAEEPRAVRVTPAAVPAPRRAWSDLINAGQHRAVLAAAAAAGIDRTLARASSEDLAALADAARYAGKGALAERVFTAQRRRFPHTQAAHTAAYLQARLIDDRGGSLAAIIAGYDRYLAEDAAGAFAEDARGRRMLALSRARDPRACPAARAYLERHARGPYAQAARSVCP